MAAHPIAVNLFLVLESEKRGPSDRPGDQTSIEQYVLNFKIYISSINPDTWFYTNFCQNLI